MANFYEDEVSGIPVVQFISGPRTPTVSWVNNTGTTPNNTGLTFHQFGEYLLINGLATFAGTGSGSTDVLFGLNGLTMENFQCGSVAIELNTSGQIYTYFGRANSGFLRFYNGNTASTAVAVKGVDLGAASGKINTINFQGVLVRITEWIGQGYQAYGAGQANLLTPGLMRNQIPPTNLASTDLTSQTGLTIDPGDVLLCRYAMSNSVVNWVFRFDSISITAAATSPSFVLPVSVPRPLVHTVGNVTIYDATGSAWVIGQLTVLTSGQVTFTKTGNAAFTGGTNNCFLYGQVDWIIS